MGNSGRGTTYTRDAPVRGVGVRKAKAHNRHVGAPRHRALARGSQVANYLGFEMADNLGCEVADDKGFEVANYLRIGVANYFRRSLFAVLACANAKHTPGMSVLLDIVHSHAATNVEDGTQRPPPRYPRYTYTSTLNPKP